MITSIYNPTSWKQFFKADFLKMEITIKTETYDLNCNTVHTI